VAVRVRVFVGVALLRVHGDDAAVLGNCAVHVFKLHGSVADVEAFGEQVVETAERAFAGGRREILDQHVAA
jgi:hypothetical protein